MLCSVCNLSKRWQDQTKGWFWFNVQKWPVAESTGDTVTKKPHSDPIIESHLSGRKSSAGSASASVADS